MYCIVSFDSSYVFLHCVDPDLEKSRYLYNVLLERFSGSNKRLLELVSVPDDYFSESGFNFFRSNRSEDSQIKIIESNNE